MTTTVLDNAGSSTSPPPAKQTRVLISILNWNGASKTLKCLASVDRELALTPAEVTVLVIDNGSRPDDAAALKAGMTSHNATLQCVPHNLGFTGGHNIAINLAIEEGYDFIWLLNNDATVAPGTLASLVSTIQKESRCGAVSPLLRDADDGTIARCVSTHDWHKRITKRILSVDEARRLQADDPAAVWVDGTAVLFRVKALAEVGPLDDRLFAYYDDNDIGVRLANKNWHSQCDFDATVFHENKKRIEDFPLYLSYLLQRNEMLFWHKNTPPSYRRVLTLKMIDRGLFDANKLRKNGFAGHADAALLGLYDFMKKKFGPPDYQRKVPLVMRVASKASALFYAYK
jgi:GT2 family glycosyltransferase